MTVRATLATNAVIIVNITLIINDAALLRNYIIIIPHNGLNYILTSSSNTPITESLIITITIIITLTNHHNHYHLLQSLPFIFISTAISIALENSTLPSAAQPSISILYFRIFFLTPFLTPIHFS